MVFSEKTIDFVDEGNVNHALTGTRVRVRVPVRTRVPWLWSWEHIHVVGWLVPSFHSVTIVTEPRDQPMDQPGPLILTVFRLENYFLIH